MDDHFNLDLVNNPPLDPNLRPWKTCFLLSVSDQIQKDPVLLECMKILFRCANEMGLKGEKVYDLKFVEGRSEGPLIQNASFWCKIEDK